MLDKVKNMQFIDWRCASPFVALHQEIITVAVSACITSDCVVQQRVPNISTC